MKTSMKTRYYLMFTYLALFPLAEVASAKILVAAPQTATFEGAVGRGAGKGGVPCGPFSVLIDGCAGSR
jgi:hypothetical protein